MTDFTRIQQTVNGQQAYQAPEGFDPRTQSNGEHSNGMQLTAAELQAVARMREQFPDEPEIRQATPPPVDKSRLPAKLDKANAQDEADAKAARKAPKVDLRSVVIVGILAFGVGAYSGQQSQPSYGSPAPAQSTDGQTQPGK